VILWLDVHISPKLSPWIQDAFGIEVLHLRDIELGKAKDSDIFYRARDANAIVMTKDRDFIDLLGAFRSASQSDLAYLWQRFKRAVENASFNNPLSRIKTDTTRRRAR
jgi:predicted nuclease of predicted toxin-antitoxin system